MTGAAKGKGRTDRHESKALGDLTESLLMIPILYHENGDGCGLEEQFPKDFHVDRARGDRADCEAGEGVRAIDGDTAFGNARGTEGGFHGSVEGDLGGPDVFRCGS